MQDTIITIVPRWRLLLTIGVLVTVAGLIAVLAPQLSTLAVSLVIGALLVFDGVLQGVYAMDLRGRRGFGMRVLLAVLSLAAGAFLLINPGPGVVALTVVVAVFLILGGAMKAALAWQLRPMPGWGLLAFAGALSLVLGVLIVALLPEVSDWVLGLMVGIDLIFAGWWLITVALGARRLGAR